MTPASTARRRPSLVRALISSRSNAAGKPHQLLLATGDRPLIEASPFDNYWGCGRSGKGENRLLMKVRAELRVQNEYHVSKSST